MNKIAEEFAANLSKLRSNKGVSQAKLSLLCGFDKNYVGMLERAERRV
ncbi:XRE family transcriptional regulator, partial [Vibrio anguillarum]|nr:XRE family transcriptional regulator [Vibrio anguillarum]